MGITGAISALMFGINSLMSALLSALDVNVPLYISSASLLISGFILINFKNQGQDPLI